MKRNPAAVVVLILLTLIGFFAFPVTIRVGDKWSTSWKQLAIVAKLDVTDVSYESTHSGSRFVLPDLTSIELLGAPKDEAFTLYVSDIIVGSRGAGYPGKLQWRKEQNSHTSITEFDFSGYTYPRLIAWFSSFTLTVLLVRRAVRCLRSAKRPTQDS